jgi:hypothetical protein
MRTRVANKEGAPASEVSLIDDRARQVPVPSGSSEYQCPSCEEHIPTRRQIRMAKPANWETRLNDVLKCPFCNFIFSPRSTATVVRG